MMEKDIEKRLGERLTILANMEDTFIMSDKFNILGLLMILIKDNIRYIVEGKPSYFTDKEQKLLVKTIIERLK